MATTAFKNALQKSSTRGVLLIEIDLIGDGSNYDTSKTIYLSDRYITVEGVIYEGIIQDFGGMDVELASNEGISSINDYSISMKNARLQFMESPDLIFSDLFDEFYFVGSVCRVYQWSEELTNKSDAELIFQGIVKQPSLINKELIDFDIEEDVSIYVDVPLNIVSKNDYPNAPDDSVGSPIPIVYGYGWYRPIFIGSGGVLSPCVETDDNNKTFYVADHKMSELTDTKILIYLGDSSIYGSITADNIATTNENNGASFTLNDDIFFEFNLAPKMKGSQYSSAITDYSNLLDDNLVSTNIVLQENETFYLKFDNMPSKGGLEYHPSAAINIIAYINGLTGSSPYGTVKYYNAGYDAGAGDFSTGQTITTSGSNSYNIINDKSAHGVDGSKSDQNNVWTLDELSGLEIGLTVNAGCTITLGALYINCKYVTFSYKKLAIVRMRRKII